MTIQQPGRRLMHSIKLGFVQKKVAGGGHRPLGASLSLTSMIDFLFMVVVFLLISFGGSETSIAKGVVLPRAENVEEMTAAPLVAVNAGQILVDGTLVGNTPAIEASEHGPQKVEELFNKLKVDHDNWTSLNPSKPFPGVVVLQIDQNVKAIVVKSVFQTAAFAGYPNVSFMVEPLPKGS